MRIFIMDVLTHIIILCHVYIQTLLDDDDDDDDDDNDDYDDDYDGDNDDTLLI